MSNFLSEGMLSFYMALGQAMQTFEPNTWAGLTPNVQDVFAGRREIQGFALTAVLAQARVEGTYSRLRALLASGALPARVRLPHGAPLPIAASAWQASAADRLGEVLEGRVRFAGPESAGAVLIAASDLEAVLAGSPAPSLRFGEVKPVPRPSGPVIDRGGAPKRFDDVDFMIEAFRILYDERMPASRADHARVALEAYVDKHPEGKTPSFDYAKPLIARLWTALELDRRGAHKVG